MGRVKPANKSATSYGRSLKRPLKTTGKAPRKGYGGKKAIRMDDPVRAARKPHRFRPGTVALRQIRQYQKGTDALLKWRPFTRVVREVTQEIVPDLRWKTEALEALREGAQAELISELAMAQIEAIHAGRVTIMPKDMRTARRIRFESLGRPVGLGMVGAAPSPPVRVSNIKKAAPTIKNFAPKSNSKRSAAVKAPRNHAPVAPVVAEQESESSDEDDANDEQPHNKEPHDGDTSSKETDPTANDKNPEATNLGLFD